MKIQYNGNSDELHQVDNVENSVTIDDTINADAIQEFVKMYNEEYSENRIKSNLEQDERLTGDEIDHLMDALLVLEEMNEKVSETKEQHPQIGKSEEEVTLRNDYAEGVDPDKVNGRTGIEPTTVTLGELVDKFKNDNNINKKEKKTRQPRVPSAPGATKKPMTPQEYIESLQEKMNLTKLLSSTVAPEIPEGLTKQGRTLMVEFSADYNKLIVEYLERIQSL